MGGIVLGSGSLGMGLFLRFCPFNLLFIVYGYRSLGMGSNSAHGSEESAKPVLVSLQASFSPIVIFIILFSSILVLV